MYVTYQKLVEYKGKYKKWYRRFEFIMNLLIYNHHLLMSSNLIRMQCKTNILHHPLRYCHIPKFSKLI